jgi:acetyl esterase/lipase
MTRRFGIAAAAVLFLAAAGAAAQKPAVTVAPDAAVHLPAMTVPFSVFASPEAKAAFLDQQAHPWPHADGIDAFRRQVAEYYQPYLDRAKALYPVTIESRTIGGVHADIVMPVGGVSARNAHRVLINLHGGGFLFGAGIIGALESVPVASIGKIEVITVDYREGPENTFPAASEDVASVYRELLRRYKPRNIGIYGCSAGGVLTAESLAWLQKEKLPTPGAAGIFCASAGGWSEGDSAYIAPPLDGSPASPAEFAPPHPSVGNVPYFADADFNNTLVAPIRSAAVLAKFPPTLVITATRDFALSAAVHTHAELVKLGVDAELHVWDGLDHSFFTNPDLPESKDVWTVVVKFFDRHLGTG